MGGIFVGGIFVGGIFVGGIFVGGIFVCGIFVGGIFLEPNEHPYKLCTFPHFSHFFYHFDDLLCSFRFYQIHVTSCKVDEI